MSFDAVEHAFTSAVDWVKDEASSVGDGVKHVYKEIIGDIGELFKGAGDLFKEPLIILAVGAVVVLLITKS
jgi:hypothetical protein